jgi:hypothetical protein
MLGHCHEKPLAEEKSCDEHIPERRQRMGGGIERTRHGSGEAECGCCGEAGTEEADAEAPGVLGLFLWQRIWWCTASS